MDIPLAIPRRAEQLKHELLHNLRRKPRCAESYGNLTCRQINGLYRLKRTDVLAVIIRIKVCTSLGNRELFTDIAGEVLIPSSAQEAGSVRHKSVQRVLQYHC